MRCRKCQVRSDRELCFQQFKFVVESNRKSWKDFGSNPLHHVSALALSTIIIIFLVCEDKDLTEGFSFHTE